MNQQVQPKQEVAMLRDVLATQNRIADQCFSNCVTKLRQNKLTDEEGKCIDACTDRYIAFNQRLMSLFFEQQQQKIEAANAEVLAAGTQGQTTQNNAAKT